MMISRIDQVMVSPTKKGKEKKNKISRGVWVGERQRESPVWMC